MRLHFVKSRQDDLSNGSSELVVKLGIVAGWKAQCASFNLDVHSQSRLTNNLEGDWHAGCYEISFLDSIQEATT